MKRFSELFLTLDQTTKTNTKVEALSGYLQDVSDSDKLWTIALLSGKRPKRGINTRILREWASICSGVPLWLFEESYHVVGDLAETMALVMQEPEHKNEQPLSWWMNEILALKDKPILSKQKFVFTAWNSLDKNERFVFNKLITGGFRIGVSQKLMTKALAKFTQIDENILAHRLMGKWNPAETTYTQLVLEADATENSSQPYPFYLAYPIEGDIEELGSPTDWQIEHKWDGIRGQVIVRKNELFVWSRGEELVSDKYPEYAEFADKLPNGTVLDGEILAWKDGHPLNFQVLQTRIGRKSVGKKSLSEAPVIFMAYDILEHNGKDIRELPQQERRKLLEELIDQNRHPNLLLSPLVELPNWEALKKERSEARKKGSEGLMLKRKTSTYKVGRKRGDWWKWKVDPLTVDAVLLYAMRGHGRRANLYTDYTFAVWKDDELVPFTKAYSGLTDAEFRKVDAFVKKNTLERFGPVRSVKPELVFEIAFEGIAASKRHKSGVALRFPRMHRWRTDKEAEEANTLQDLEHMLKVFV